MRVLLIDDHPLIREILPAIVTRALGAVELHVVGTLEAAFEFSAEFEFDMILLDLGLPGFSGVESLIAFRLEYPESRVVVVSAVEDEETIVAALEAGAVGYIPKTSTPDSIIGALKSVAAGAIYAPAGISKPQPHARESPQLSGRQHEVLRLLVAGLSNRDIAEKLAISESTVKHHLSAIYGALGTNSRTAAMAAAMRRGIKPTA